MSANRSPHLSRFRFCVILLFTVLLFAACGSGSKDDQSGSDLAEESSTRQDQLVREEPQTTEEAFLELLEDAEEPVVTNVEIKYQKKRSSFGDFTFRMVGTEELSRLTQSELLFAFTNKIPKIDLVDNPEGVILGGGGIIYYTPAVTKMPVFYMDLVFFREYYKEFMAANSTPLRRQAAVDEFLAKLYEVHEIYRGIVDKANRLHYLVIFNGIVADESNYNFQTKTMRIPLCCYFEGNTTLKNLVEYVNGSSKCTGECEC